MPGMSTSSRTASGWPSALEPLERLTPVGGELDLVALELESPRSDSRTARSSSTTRIFTVPIVRGYSENFLKSPSRS